MKHYYAVIKRRRSHLPMEVVEQGLAPSVAEERANMIYVGESLDFVAVIEVEHNEDLTFIHRRTIYKRERTCKHPQVQGEFNFNVYKELTQKCVDCGLALPLISNVEKASAPLPPPDPCRHCNEVGCNGECQINDQSKVIAEEKL